MAPVQMPYSDTMWRRRWGRDVVAEPSPANERPLSELIRQRRRAGTALIQEFDEFDELLRDAASAHLVAPAGPTPVVHGRAPSRMAWAKAVEGAGLLPTEALREWQQVHSIYLRLLLPARIEGPATIEEIRWARETLSRLHAAVEGGLVERMIEGLS